MVGRKLSGSSASHLIGILAAAARALAERLLAFLARDRTAPDDPCQEIIGNRFGFALLQCRARRQRRHQRTDVFLRHVVATLVGIGHLIIARHGRSRPAAHDYFDQLIAVQLRLPQIGGATVRLRLTRAIRSPAMAERALRLVEIEAAAVSIIGGLRRKWYEDESDHERRKQSFATSISRRRHGT